MFTKFTKCKPKNSHFTQQNHIKTVKKVER